jgi:hypothetical protein
MPEPPLRPGEASDMLDALMGVPAVAGAVQSLKSIAADTLKRDWRHLSTGGKAAVITQTAVISGSAVAGALASESRRREAYKLLRDREIPIPLPRVPGFTLQLKTGKEDKVVLMFDVAKFLRAR